MKSLTRGPSMVGDGWDEVSDLGKQFLKQLLQLDPKKRLNAAEALNHPWIIGNESDSTMKKRLSSVRGLAKIQSQTLAQKNVNDTMNTSKADTMDVTPQAGDENTSMNG